MSLITDIIDKTEKTVFFLKIDIIVAYIQRYPRGHEIDFVASLTGIHLAALTPKPHEVRVIHQQVRKRRAS